MAMHTANDCIVFVEEQIGIQPIATAAVVALVTAMFIMLRVQSSGVESILSTPVISFLADIKVYLKRRAKLLNPALSFKPAQ
jgi:hypothetical protein